MDYQITATIKDSDGATLNNVLVSVMNVTNNEENTTTTNSVGQIAVSLGNYTKGWSDGNEISIFTSYGRYYKETVFTIDTATYPDGYDIGDITVSTSYETKFMYCTISDIRDISKIESSELSDDAIHRLILRKTKYIDEITGRTWKGIQTMTDEYYDGDGNDILWFNQTDIQSFTSLSIDDDGDGTYTNITITSGGINYVHVYEEGRLVIDNRKDVEVSAFAAGPKSVKVTYTYGNSEPSEDVKELCVQLCLNEIHNDSNRQRKIDELITMLRWHRWLAA